jgi:hypothetical protein
MSDNWFLADAAERFGPMSLVELRERTATHPAKTTLFVWKPGFNDWVEASEVAGLRVEQPPPFMRKAAAVPIPQVAQLSSESTDQSFNEVSPPPGRRVQGKVVIIGVAVLALGLGAFLWVNAQKPIGNSSNQNVSAATAAPLELFGVQIGMDMNSAMDTVINRLKGMPGVNDVPAEIGPPHGTLLGSGRIVARSGYGLFANAELYSVNEPSSGRPVVVKFHLRFYSVDLDDIVKSATTKYGSVRQSRSDFCNSVLNWKRGSVELEYCRKSELKVGEIQASLNDEDFTRRAINASQSGVRPKM